MYSHILLIRSGAVRIYVSHDAMLNFITCFLSLADTNRPLYNMQLCTYYLQPFGCNNQLTNAVLSHSFVMDVIHCDFQSRDSLCSLTHLLCNVFRIY